MGTKLVAVALASVFVMGAAAQGPARKPVEISNKSKGSVADANLARMAPANGVITSEKALAELCKAWGIKEQPKVDFSKEIVVVQTTRGSRLSLSASMDDKGNLMIAALGTADLGEGFRYEMGVIKREGIKTVGGKELPKE